MVELTPRSLYLMAACPAGELITVLGNSIGLTYVGPSVTPLQSNEVMLCTLPNMVPQTKPRLGSPSPPSRCCKPVAVSAMWAATLSSRALRSSTRMPLFPSQGCGLKLRTSPAIADSPSSGLRPMPEHPAYRLRSNSSTPAPIEEITHAPV